MTRNAMRALIAVGAALVFLSSTSVAFAIWRTTSTASLTVSITSPATPPPVTPSAVTGLSCSRTTFNGNNVNLAWNVASNATTYKLYVKIADGSYVELLSSQTNSASFNESAVSSKGAGSPYRVVVQAFNGNVPSATSATAFVITFGNNQTRDCTTGTP